MSASASPRTLPALALATAVAGVALAVYAAAVTPARVRTLQRRAADLAAVHELRAESGRLDPVLRLLDGLPPADPQSLAALFATVAPSSPAPDIASQPAVPAAGDWAARRHTATWSALLQSDLGKFVTACETSRPPWRVVEARLSARGTETVSATLGLEGVERSDTAAPPARGP